MSTTRSESFSAPAPPGRAAGVFALPEILPERARVFLDMPSRTAVLLNLDAEETTALVHAFQLTPSAARVFHALLQAYPQHCSYQALLAVLYPASQQALLSTGEQDVRPIRRALVALAPVLRAFGLEVVALRGRGYLLAPALHSSSSPLIAS